MADTNGPPKTRLSEIKARLTPFFNANRISTLTEIDSATPSVAVASPWGDESLSIVIPVGGEEDALIDALNNVYLPERFTAIWHNDTQEFEIIYSAIPKTEPEVSRTFSFKHRGRDYRCSYGAPSPRLRLFVKHNRAIGASSTQYRNLQFLHIFDTISSQYSHVEIISFWIRGIEWNEDVVLDLIRHLNFYMYYYDTRTPQIMIHPAKSESILQQPQNRYPYGSFPQSIVSSELDDALLHFWGASISGDPVRRFLYNYQILEYAAFFYIEEHIKRDIRRALAAPHAMDDLNTLTDHVIESLAESKISDPQKLDNLLKTTVNPELVWREIELHQKAFSEPWRFEGGFVLQPIVKEAWKADDFAVNWIPAFSNAIRSIRNALSHGREQRMTAVITPTTVNFGKLQLWISPISLAAREVLHYRNLV
jgi:hypothetical protein